MVLQSCLICWIKSGYRVTSIVSCRELEGCETQLIMYVIILQMEIIIFENEFVWIQLPSCPPMLDPCHFPPWKQLVISVEKSMQLFIWYLVGYIYSASDSFTVQIVYWYHDILTFMKYPKLSKTKQDWHGRKFVITKMKTIIYVPFQTKCYILFLKKNN